MKVTAGVIDPKTTAAIMRRVGRLAAQDVVEAKGNVYDLVYILASVLMAMVVEHTAPDEVLGAFDMVIEDVRRSVAKMLSENAAPAKYDA